MKILEVTNSIESAGAGVGYVVKHLTEDLLRANHDASSMSFTQPDRAPACPAPPHWIFPQNAPRQLGHSRQLHTALLQSSADIIHQHGLWSMLSHSMNRLRARRSTPTVVSAHGMLEPAARRISPWKKRFFKIFIEQHNLRNATCLHALTPSEATHYRDLGLSQPIAIIPNAVHIVKASPPPHDLPFPIPDGRILLYLSRLHPKKGLENLLQAWAPLAPAFPDWSLLIVGPDHIGYRKHLETRIIDSNIPSVSMHEPVYGSQKHDLLELADAFVLPSLSEGFPVATLEAAAHRCPVLQTTTCYFPELTSAGGAIEVSPTPKSLAEGLTVMLGLPEKERLAMGDKALEYVRTHHSPEGVTRRYIELYKHLLGTEAQPDFLT